MDALQTDFVESCASTQFLVDMIPGGKPYTSASGTVRIDGPGTFQGVWRYAFGENRESSIDYATTAINVYQAFLTRTLEHVRWNRVNSDDAEFIMSVRTYTGYVLSGLCELSKTYQDECDAIKTLCDKFNRAITLFDVGCLRYCHGDTSSLHKPYCTD